MPFKALQQPLSPDCLVAGDAPELVNVAELSTVAQTLESFGDAVAPGLDTDTVQDHILILR